MSEDGTYIPYPKLFQEAMKVEPDLKILQLFHPKSYIVTGGFVLWMLKFTTYYRDIDIFFNGNEENYKILQDHGYVQQPGDSLDGYCYKHPDTKLEFIECTCNFVWENMDLQTLLFDRLKASDLSMCMRAFNVDCYFNVSRSDTYKKIIYARKFEEATYMIDISLQRLRKYEKRLNILPGRINNLDPDIDREYLEDLKLHICQRAERLATFYNPPDLVHEIRYWN
jgi:hypothetical protein